MDKGTTSCEPFRKIETKDTLGVRDPKIIDSKRFNYLNQMIQVSFNDFPEPSDSKWYTVFRVTPQHSNVPLPALSCMFPKPHTPFHLITPSLLYQFCPCLK